MSTNVASGSVCPVCNRGRLYTRTTVFPQTGDRAVKRNYCSHCSHKCNHVVPADSIRRRPRDL